MNEVQVNCEFCFNETLVTLEESEQVNFCPICGECFADPLEEVDFEE